VFPGQFLFITRRCTQRQFLLRPDAETNNAFTYALAEAPQRHDIERGGTAPELIPRLVV
jgi:putative transposase